MAFELRKATKEDIGSLAYLIMLWRSELAPEHQFFKAEPWVAERAAGLMIETPNHLTKVLMDGEKMVGTSTLINHAFGIYTPYPYGVIFSVYIRPEYRGHRLLGYKLFCEIVESARKMGLARVESNPMFNDRGTSMVLKRMGFKPISTTHILELSHG